MQELQSSFETQTGIIAELKAELEQKRTQEGEQAASINSQQTTISNLVEEVSTMAGRCKALEKAAQASEEWKAKAMEAQGQVEQVAQREQELQEAKRSSDEKGRLVNELRTELEKTKAQQQHEIAQLTQASLELKASDTQHQANKVMLESELEKMKIDSRARAAEAQVREIEMLGLREAIAKFEQEIVALNDRLNCSERKVAEFSSNLVSKEKEFSAKMGEVNAELERFKSRSIKTSNKLSDEIRAHRAAKILCERYQNETEILKAEQKSVAELTARINQERDVLKVHLEKLAAQHSTDVAKISELQEELDTKDKALTELAKKIPDQKTLARLIAADRKRRAGTSDLNNTPMKELQPRSATRRNMGGKENECGV